MRTEDVVGLPLNRVDGRLKVSGRARFSAEFSLPAITYAVLIQSSIAYGRIKSFDIQDARNAPGVLAVITAENAKPPTKGQSIFTGTEIHYSGQHIGVVVAETFEQATYAASLVKVDYEVGKPIATMEEHLADGFEPKGGRNGKSKRGDIDKGLSDAVHKIQNVYRTPIEHHNPMEPHATTAIWEGDHLTVYESTQGISGTQATLQKMFGLQKDQVRVVAYFIGGGFGCKGMTWPHTSIAAYAAREVGRPVRLALERRQMFSSNGHRPTTRQELTLGTDHDGKLVALKQTSFTSSSPAGDFAEPVGSVPSMMYSCANVDISQKLVHLNVGMPTYMRAPGESSGSVGIECAMDEMAAELGLDPIEFRLKNYAEIDESNGNPFSSKGLRECYAKGAAAFGWSKRNAKPGSVRHGNTLIGLGMASATYPANTQPSTAKARMYPDGSVHILCGTQDIGTGTYTILGQIAADSLGVPVSKVRVELGDTNFPPGPHSGGSATAASAGSSVKVAAEALKSTLLAMAMLDPRSPLSKVIEQDIVVINGTLTVPGHPKTDTYMDIVKRSEKPMIEEQAHTPTAQAANAQQYSKHSFGAHFAEVHVDADLGTIRVARYLGAFAAGKILNAKTALSQFRGGIIWGISMALFEESVLDPNYSRFVNSNLAEYHVATNADIPDIEVLQVPEVDLHINAIGAKGIGEIGIVGAAAAVANAVYNATGKRVRDLPITLDKLM